MPVHKHLSDHFPPPPPSPQAVGEFISSVMDNDVAAVTRVLDERPDAVHWCDRAGNTALMMAAIQGPTAAETFDLLLAHGADVNAQNRHGGNALARAACFGHRELAERLLALGADPHVRDAAGQDAADWAKKGGHPDIAALFKKSPSAPKPPDSTP